MQSRKSHAPPRAYNQQGNAKSYGNYGPYNNPQLSENFNQGNGAAQRLMVQNPQNQVHHNQRQMGPTGHNVAHIAQAAPGGVPALTNHGQNAAVVPNLQAANDILPNVQVQAAALQGQVGMSYPCHPGPNQQLQFLQQRPMHIQQQVPMLHSAAVNYSGQQYNAVCYGPSGLQFSPIQQHQARHNQFQSLAPQQVYTMPSYVQQQPQQPKPTRQTVPPPPSIPQPQKANKAIKIINPDTMQPIDLSTLRSDFSEPNNSQISRESSARNTPAPEAGLNINRANEIGAEFATKAVQARDENKIEQPSELDTSTFDLPIVEKCVDDDSEKQDAHIDETQEAISTVTIDKNSTLTIDKNSTLTIDKTSTLTIDKTSTLTIDKTSTLTIDKNSTLTIDKNSTLTIDKNSDCLEIVEIALETPNEQLQKEDIPEATISMVEVEEKTLPTKTSTTQPVQVVAKSEVPFEITPAKSQQKQKKPNGKERKTDHGRKSPIMVTKEARKFVPVDAQVSSPKLENTSTKNVNNVPEVTPEITFGDLSECDAPPEETTNSVPQPNMPKTTKSEKAKYKKSSSPLPEKNEPIPTPFGKNKNGSQTDKEQQTQKKPEPVPSNANGEQQQQQQQQQQHHQSVSMQSVQHNVDAMMPSYAQAAVEAQQKRRASIPDMEPAKVIDAPNKFMQPENDVPTLVKEVVKSLEGSDENVAEHVNKTDDIGKSEGSVSHNVAMTYTKEVPMQLISNNELVGKVESESTGQQKELSPEISDEEVNGNSKRISYGRDFILEKQRTEHALSRPKLLPSLEVILQNPHSQAYSQAFEQPRLHEPHHTRFVYTRGNVRMPARPNFAPKKLNVILSNEGHRNKSKNPYNLQKSKHSVVELDQKDAREAHVQKVCRSCLNKLTPDNFGLICSKHFTAELIASADDLKVVIEEIYEKALGELHYSELYARLCVYIHNQKEIVVKDCSKQFRVLIIAKCQKEFETEQKEKISHFEWSEKIKKAEDNNDARLVAEFKLQYETNMTIVRKKSVANINFVGELYLQKLLTAKPILSIIDTLLKADLTEEKLECLCQLLRTIGQNFEKEVTTSNNFNKVFKQLSEIVVSRDTSSRIRFMLMDVVDLRLNNWVPRRKKDKPTTKAEVKINAETESLIQSNEFNTFEPINRSGGRGDYRSQRMRNDRGDRDIPADGHTRLPNNWQTAGGSNSHRKVDLPQLAKNLRGDPNEVNLRPTSFGNWGSGSNMSGYNRPSQNNETSSSQSNRYAPLNSVNMDKQQKNIPPRMAGNNGPQRQGTSYGSKSMPPPNNSNNQGQFMKKPTGIDRSKSSSRSNSRDGKNAHQASNVSKEKPDKEQIELDNYKQLIATYENVQDESVKLVKKYMYSITEGPASEKALIVKLITLLKDNVFWFLKSTLEWILDQKEDKIFLYKDLLVALTEEKHLPTEIVLQEYSLLLENVEDLRIDVPLAPKHFGTLLGALLSSKIVPFSKVPSILQIAGSVKAEICCHAFKEVLTKQEWPWITEQITPTCNMASIFSDSNDIELLDRYELHKLKDILGDGDQNCADHLMIPLIALFKQENNNEKIFKLVEEKYKGDTKSKKFVRVLVTALIASLLNTEEDCVTLPENLKDIGRRKVDAIQKYVDNTAELELQCLYALQAMSYKYQHPKGFLENCFDMFYANDVVTEDTFFLWAKTDDPEEHNGRGVSIKSVGNWLKWLETTEAESDIP